MKRSIILALILLAGVAHAQPVRMVQPQVVRAEPEVQGPVAERPRAKAAVASPIRVSHVILAEGFMTDQSKAHASTVKPGVALQVGFSRVVPDLATAQDAGARLGWESRSDGTLLAAIAVTSPGAVALRMGLRIDSLPAGALLRFYGASGTDPFEVTVDEIAQLPTLPRYWSPVVESQTIVMEVQLAPGSSPADVRISSPEVSHLIASPATGFPVAKAAASCNVDAACYQGQWSNESNAVARILYTRDGATYVCSGTLLADKDPSTSIPYFLTANHCVSSQAVASTLQSYWFYRSSACDSATRGNYRTLTGGATLLYASGATDTSLMRLDATPPTGATYAGWITGSALTTGTTVTGLHHPTGDVQKISFGNIRGYYQCSAGEGKEFSCSGSTPLASTFYAVTWREGVTESGSSGSAIFMDDGRYLVGQLYGGNGSCSESGSDFYGRFDVAYTAGLHQWLGVASTGTSSSPSVQPQYDYTDMWWNPAESGWGVALTQHEDRLFATWYAYDGNGRPVWLTMSGGTWTSPTRFTGDLIMTAGPDPKGDFDPSRVSRTRVGAATFDFSALDRGTLTWSVNGASATRPISRQLFGPIDAAASPKVADLWWNAAESGWGLSISQQYRTLFAVWYSYREDTSPAWYVMSGGSWTSADTYSGTLYRTGAGTGPFFGGSFNPSSVTLTPVGSLRLRFTGGSSAVMTYSVDGATGTKNIARQPF